MKNKIAKKMNNITLPKEIKEIKKEGNFSVFEISDIYPGYGVTLANALRRVVLSSLYGTAITGVKIRNVSHEFSTLPHVKEDIMEIILNLKQVRFKFYGSEPLKVNLSVKGEKKVKASDIKIGSQAEVINPEAYIATLTNKNAELDMELTIERGLGYVQIDTHSKEKKEIGLIAIDAVFSPIKKVSYDIENVRVGQRTDYNKIIFELETDGSISPEESLIEAVDILVKQFEALKPGSGSVAEKDIEAAVEKESEKKTEKILKADLQGIDLMKSVDDMGFSVRTLAALKENKIKTAGAIAKKTEKDLMEMEKMGKVAVKEIKKELGKLGLVLKQ